MKIIHEKSYRQRVEAIQHTVAAAYGLQPSAMFIRARPQHIAQPRQVAMYFAKELTRQTFEFIGLCFGGRDHGTVIHACEAVRNRMLTEPEFALELNRIRAQCAEKLVQLAKI